MAEASAPAAPAAPTADAAQLDFDDMRVAVEAGSAPAARASLERMSARRGGGAVGRHDALLSARDGATTVRPLMIACVERGGPAGPDGWLGIVELFLRTVDRNPKYVNSADVSGATALHTVCLGRRASDEQQLAAIAALLAYGAEAGKATQAGHTPRALHSRAWNGRATPAVMALLESAERVGGREAVRRALIDDAATLHGAAGWDVVRWLPRLAELQTAATLRVVVARYFEARQRTVDGQPPHDGSIEYATVSRLHRHVFGEFLRQLAPRMSLEPEGDGPSGGRPAGRRKGATGGAGAGGGRGDDGDVSEEDRDLDSGRA